MSDPTNVVVGGQITWDVVISIVASVVSALIAFFSVKNKVEQVETTVSSLEDSLDEGLRNVKILEKDLNNELERKITELNSELNRLTKELFGLKEHMQQIIVNDINNLETKLKQDLSVLDVKIDKNISKYDNMLNQVEAKFLERLMKDIENINDKNKDTAKTFYKRIDEFRETLNEYNKKLTAIEISSTNLSNKYEAILITIDKDKDNNKLVIENIRTIIDYIKGDLEDVKDSIRILNYNSTNVEK